MAGRWIALAIGLVVLAFVGIFVGAVLRSPTIVASRTSSQIDDSESGGQRFVARAGSWTVIVDLVERRTGDVVIVVSIADDEGRPARATIRPTAALSMVDMAMGMEPVVLVQEKAGLWRGSGHLSMLGRWSLQLEVEGKRILVPFEATLPRS